MKNLINFKQMNYLLRSEETSEFEKWLIQEGIKGFMFFGDGDTKFPSENLTNFLKAKEIIKEGASKEICFKENEELQRLQLLKEKVKIILSITKKELFWTTKASGDFNGTREEWNNTLLNKIFEAVNCIPAIDGTSGHIIIIHPDLEGIVKSLRLFINKEKVVGRIKRLGIFSHSKSIYSSADLAEPYEIIIARQDLVKTSRSLLFEEDFFNFSLSKDSLRLIEITDKYPDFEK